MLHVSSNNFLCVAFFGPNHMSNENTTLVLTTNNVRNTKNGVTLLGIGTFFYISMPWWEQMHQKPIPTMQATSHMLPNLHMGIWNFKIVKLFLYEPN